MTPADGGAAGVKRRIYISADEHALLIRESQEHGAIATSFGGGRVWLHPDCRWPIPLLAQWRGRAFDQGAGI